MKLILLVITFFISFFSPNPTVKWVAIGDSITYLNDHLDETGNRVKKGYMTRVCEKIPDLQYNNQGHNGWTAQRIAQKIETLKIEKADVYSVFLGTNDWWAGLPSGNLADYKNQTGAATVAGSFRIIIDKLKVLNSKAKIIIISPLQRGDFVYIANFKNNAFGSYKFKNNQSLERIVNVLSEIAELEKLVYLDLYHHKKLKIKNLVKLKRLKNPATNQYQNYKYPEYINIPFLPETDEYPYPLKAIAMTYDGLHPSDKGNALIAKLLAKKIQKALK